MKRRQDRKHLAWVRGLECCVPGCRTGARVDPHHIRTAANAGTGLKPPDRCCAPCCRVHHDEGDRIGWLTFQAKYQIDLSAEAAFCAEASGMEMP